MGLVIPFCLLIAVMRAWPMYLRTQQAISHFCPDCVNLHGVAISITGSLWAISIFLGLMLGFDKEDPNSATYAPWVILVGCFPADLHFAYLERKMQGYCCCSSAPVSAAGSRPPTPPPPYSRSILPVFASRSSQSS